jgi:hypothetical protein
MLTQADQICAPGTVTVGTDQRLLISGDSELSIPDFARMDQVPNLAAFAGTGFPYSGGSSHLVLGQGESSLNAGLTMLARMAAQTGKSIDIAAMGLASPPPSQDAIFVGAYRQLPPDATQRVGILPPYASDDAALANESGDVETILQRWRSTGASGATTMVGRVQHWVADLLNLGPNSLGVLPPPDEPYAPRQSDQALVVQKLQPEGGLWTMLTVPDEARLTEGLDTVTKASYWRELGGRVSVVHEGAEAVDVIEPNHVTFFEAAPWSFANIRYVAANWLSSHVLAYALGLCLVVIGLTLATAGLLNSFGRRSQ